MIADFGITGNGQVLAKVRGDGALTEAFYPSIGFFRHIIQSQFGARFAASGETFWFSGETEHNQRYLEGTNVLETAYARGGLSARVLDFVHPVNAAIVRTLEVENTTDEGIEVALFHTEAF